MRAAGIILALFLSLGAVTANAQFLVPSQRLTEPAEGFARRIVQLYAPNGRWWSDKSPASADAYRAKVYGEFYDRVFAKLMVLDHYYKGRPEAVKLRSRYLAEEHDPEALDFLKRFPAGTR